MKGLLGKKIGMTQIFHEGEIVPVTIIEADPSVVIQKKTVEKDGYDAIQVGIIDKRKISSNPWRGILRNPAPCRKHS